MNLDEVLALPRTGVVILKKSDSVLVSYTTSMGADLEEMYNLFRGQSGITMLVVSAGADIETLKLHTEYYRRHYHSVLAHSTITPYNRKALLYRIRLVPSDDFKWVDVELVTARGDGAKFVGRFKTTREANDFIETYYGTDNPFKLPVYARNSDTKEFLLKMQKKMLEIR